MILTELFFLVVYLSLVGGMFGLVSLLLSRALKRSLPLWFSLCVLALYWIPVLSPQVRLLSPEPEQRLPAFRIAALVWAVGCALFLIFRAVRLLLAGRSLRRRPPCQNQRLLALTAQCAQSLGIKRVPILRETLLTSPISVAGALRPVLLVDAAALSQLTDAQLQAVLTHELTHIRRHHLLFQRMYDAVCAVHWFNPVAWLCREDFALHCETDCDACALRSLTGSATSGEYARAILRLLELSACREADVPQGLGALSFLRTKRRLGRILAKPAPWRERLLAAGLAVLLVLILAFSAEFSRQHFYPYPAYSVGTESGA